MRSLPTASSFSVEQWKNHRPWYQTTLPPEGREDPRCLYGMICAWVHHGKAARLGSGKLGEDSLSFVIASVMPRLFAVGGVCHAADRRWGRASSRQRL